MEKKVAKDKKEVTKGIAHLNFELNFIKHLLRSDRSMIEDLRKVVDEIIDAYGQPFGPSKR